MDGVNNEISDVYLKPTNETNLADCTLNNYFDLNKSIDYFSFDRTLKDINQSGYDLFKPKQSYKTDLNHRMESDQDGNSETLNPNGKGEPNYETDSVQGSQSKSEYSNNDNGDDCECYEGASEIYVTADGGEGQSFDTYDIVKSLRSNMPSIKDRIQFYDKIEKSNSPQESTPHENEAVYKSVPTEDLVYKCDGFNNAKFVPKPKIDARIMSPKQMSSLATPNSRLEVSTFESCESNRPLPLTPESWTQVTSEKQDSTDSSSRICSVQTECRMKSKSEKGHVYSVLKSVDKQKDASGKTTLSACLSINSERSKQSSKSSRRKSNVNCSKAAKKDTKSAVNALILQESEPVIDPFPKRRKSLSKQDALAIQVRRTSDYVQLINTPGRRPRRMDTTQETMEFNENMAGVFSEVLVAEAVPRISDVQRIGHTFTVTRTTTIFAAGVEVKSTDVCQENDPLYKLIVGETVAQKITRVAVVSAGVFIAGVAFVKFKHLKP